MEGIQLSKKAEEKIFRVIKVTQLKEDSPTLLDIEDISIMFNRSRDYTGRNIVTKPSFPKPVTLEKGKTGHQLYRADEVIKWQRANLRRRN